MSTFYGQETQLSTPNTPDFTAHHASGNGKGNPGLLHNTAQHAPLLTSPAYLESARWKRQPSHVRTLGRRLTLPIFRRTMRPHSERSHKTLYLQQLYVLHSQFSDAPCVYTASEATKQPSLYLQLHIFHSQFFDAPCAHTARKATRPCTYNNSMSSALNSPTQPCERERQPSLVSQAAG